MFCAVDADASSATRPMAPMVPTAAETDLQHDGPNFGTTTLLLASGGGGRLFCVALDSGQAYAAGNSPVKAAGLNFSTLLREAVERQLHAESPGVRAEVRRLGRMVEVTVQAASLRSGFWGFARLGTGTERCELILRGAACGRK